MTAGEIGYTKAREIVAVATPETQDRWLKAARGTRRELVNEVKKARQAAKVASGQGELLPADSTVVGPRELPVRFQVDLTPEQEARRAALTERLHKLGVASEDKAELLLDALAALADSREEGPRGPRAARPPVQIHVHEEAGQTFVQTCSGERKLSRQEAERMRCDASICTKGGRNTTTIPPRVRREVLARDHHRCRTSGCDRIHFLEVHHVVARSRGGTNTPENLITLCSSCHRFWHEKGGMPPGTEPLSP
jgi:5-methylcytosine-specific restriction endonuclease McrA